MVKRLLIYSMLIFSFLLLRTVMVSADMAAESSCEIADCFDCEDELTVDEFHSSSLTVRNFSRNQYLFQYSGPAIPVLVHPPKFFA